MGPRSGPYRRRAEQRPAVFAVDMSAEQDRIRRSLNEAGKPTAALVLRQLPQVLTMKRQQVKDDEPGVSGLSGPESPARRGSVPPEGQA
jgi:hypothetical protein